MKYLIIAIAIFVFFSCTEQPIRQSVQETQNYEISHPDSMQVCCDGKCITVSWQMYKAMDLHTTGKACGYINKN